MRIKLLNSSIADAANQYSVSFLINDCVAIDAGCIGLLPSLDDQMRIRHVVISHAHFDHVASLPIFLDNVYEPGPDCVTVYGGRDVLESLKTHFFNDVVWPDLLRLSEEESPFLKTLTLKHLAPTTVDELLITPIALNHVVPTFGFVIEDAHSAIAIVSDTGPTEEIWNVAKSNPKLKAVFLESAFPNSMRWLADKSMHLTPASFLDEYRKLGKSVPVIAVHLKPAFRGEISRELEALELDELRIATPGADYEY